MRAAARAERRRRAEGEARRRWSDRWSEDSITPLFELEFEFESPAVAAEEE